MNFHFIVWCVESLKGNKRRSKCPRNPKKAQRLSRLTPPSGSGGAQGVEQVAALAELRKGGLSVAAADACRLQHQQRPVRLK